MRPYVEYSEKATEAQDVQQEPDSQQVRHALRRVDLLILLPIVVMFVFLQFDRTNLGNALTDDFVADANLTLGDINIGQTIFTLGMVVWEIPSNIIIKRVGADRWLPLLMFCWGVVTWSQAFLVSRPGFLATRFLLATFEAGFIPGAAFYLGQFFTRRELAFRYALLWAANSVAGALSGVLALGLLSLSGRGGLRGWQWLFIIEGVLTCAVSIIVALHLPRGPEDASAGHRILGRRAAILKPEQGELLLQRAIRDDPTKLSQKSKRVALRDFDFLLDWKIWGHVLMAFLTSIIYTPINTYAPSIIRSLGFAGYSANGLNSVGPACNLVFALSLAYLSDRKQHRPGFILIGFLMTAVGLLWLALPPDSAGRAALYAGVVFTQAFMGSVQGLNAAWMSENMQERQRPLALACYVMSIQLASFVGSNVFAPGDAPRYQRGLLICAGCVLAGAVICIIWALFYRFVGGSKQDSPASISDGVSVGTDLGEAPAKAAKV